MDTDPVRLFATLSITVDSRVHPGTSLTSTWQQMAASASTHRAQTLARVVRYTNSRGEPAMLGRPRQVAVDAIDQHLPAPVALDVILGWGECFETAIARTEVSTDHPHPTYPQAYWGAHLWAALIVVCQRAVDHLACQGLPIQPQVAAWTLMNAACGNDPERWPMERWVGVVEALCCSQGGA